MGGHDHDHHDFNAYHPKPGAESMETEPFFPPNINWPPAPIDPNQNNPLPMTSDLSNCQTKH